MPVSTTTSTTLETHAITNGLSYVHALLRNCQFSHCFQSTQIQKVHEQLSLAVSRSSTQLWIVNVGDLKPYEREIEFFLNYGWNATRWTPNNLDQFVTSWAQREFDVSPAVAGTINSIVGNLTRYNSRRKPELWNGTTYSLLYYREAETVIADWDTLRAASTRIYNSLSQSFKPAYFQLVHHPVIASANLAHMVSVFARVPRKS